MRLLALTLLLAIACDRTPAFAENGLLDFPALAAPETTSARLAEAARLREIFDFPISKALGKDVLAVYTGPPLAWGFLNSQEETPPPFYGMMIAGE